MSFPRFIHFFGPDGAGKSTQVKILVDFLERKGVQVKKYWVRSPHTIAFVLWRIFVRIGFYRGVMNPFGVPIKLPAVNRSRVLRSLWTATEFLGVLPIILRVYISILRGHRLVAERYVLDTVVTIAYLINDVNFLNGLASKLLLRFIPRNTMFIFLDADYATICRRRRSLLGPENSEDTGRETYGSIQKSAVEPEEFINFQRRAYKSLAKSFGALVVDTSKLSIEETSGLILQQLGFYECPRAFFTQTRTKTKATSSWRNHRDAASRAQNSLY